jgi:hypothetical protein
MLTETVGTEKWMPVSKYEGCYEVSNFGRVRSVSRLVKGCHSLRINKSRIMSQHREKNGYFKVPLCKNGTQKTQLIHRIMAIAFIDNNIRRNTDVNHIDGDKTNNNIENLELCSRSENMRHAVSLGLSRGPLKVLKC